MAEIVSKKNKGIFIVKFVNKLTKQLNECEFNVKNSLPGIYPTIKEIIKCFDEFGFEIHNYNDGQDRRFQKAVLCLTKELTEFFGTYTKIKGSDKKELLILVVMDIFKTEILESDTLSDDKKELLTSEILLNIFEEILRKTIVSVLVFKNIVNEEFSRPEFRSCMRRWCCFCCPKKKKYLK